MDFFATHILSVILFTPLVGSILLLFVPRESGNAHRVLGNLFGMLGFIVSLPLVAWFQVGKSGYQFQETASWIPSIGATYHLGIDGISFLLVMLTTLLGAISILSSWSAIQLRKKEYYILFLLLQTGMIGVFVSLDFFLFYVFWEVMLVPMYFLIGVWGSDRRLYAAIKFFMFPFHTWLPDAHTEAPTAGSVILAGVLLKMGTYGFIRFSLPLLPTDPMMRSRIIKVVIFLSLVGIIYGALVCLMQKDMKRLIAYSSVSHLGFCTLGIFALTPNGLSGSVLQQINHGISTGALFLIVGVLYERRHTRMISEFGGLATPMPNFAAIYLIISLSSLGMPLLNGFIGEFTILQGAFQVSKAWAAWGSLGVVLG